MKQEGSHPQAVNGGKPVDNKPEEVNREHINQCGLSPSLTPMAGPTTSLTSSDSNGSSCSDYSVDLNYGGRNGHGEGDRGKTDNNHKVRHNGHLESSDSCGSINGLNKPGDAPNDGDNEREGGSFEELIKGEDPFDGFWVPPEAENKEDDEENSVFTVDDDEDECGDGGEWARTLSGFDDGKIRSHRSKEEKDKAMEDVKNEKFRTLVLRLLKTAGIVIQDEENESWVDIVSSLAWEAASFVKPDASKGKTMDPAGYVKIKCLASGSCRDSQLIKGLVFKKHAAHKHMQTNFKNPRVLLIKGMLGESSGLSSIQSLITEGDKSLMENLEACHPDVVLVEKSASVSLAKLLDKKITLVTDMKLHRLERVAQCTGSPILSADTMLSQKLKQCDSLYFEKFVEEHSQTDGLKKPRKTLLFLEGSPTHLGCTILLRGTHNEELKKIKCVVQCAVVMAYHFILETCFLLDQEAMFSTVGSCEVASQSNEDYSAVDSSSLAAHCHSKASVENASGDKLDAPLSNGVHGESSTDKKSTDSTGNGRKIPITVPMCEVRELPKIPIEVPMCEVEGRAPLTSSSYDTVDVSLSNEYAECRKLTLRPQCQNKSAVINQIEVPANASDLSYISASIEEVVKKALPTAYPTMQPYLRLGERVSDAEELNLSYPEAKDNSEEYVFADHSNDSQPMSSGTESVTDEKIAVGADLEDNHKKDEISIVLDSESILVLMSRRNANRGTICEQSHFSHIKFYKYFDVPLGKFLRENLLNQNCPCSTCKEQPEAHYYYYAHHNKQLTIRVKQFPEGIQLPGESNGKLWMWSRCSKCKPGKEFSKKCTRRVLLSSAARGLSFGKFLELGFSNHSSFNRLSSCGHSLHRDFLYFFGLGTLVAMFRYFPVETNNVILPAHKLEYNSSIKGEWLLRETESVYRNAMLLFTELANYLKKIEPQLSGLTLNINGSVKEFQDMEKMLVVERHEFEENIEKTCKKNSLSVRKLLSLNRLRWELVLEAYVWNRRLQLLSSVASHNRVHDQKLPEKAIEVDGSSDRGTPPGIDIQGMRIATGVRGGEVLEKINDVKEPTELTPALAEPPTNEILPECQQEPESLPFSDENIEISITDDSVPCALDRDDTPNEKSMTEESSISNQILSDRDIPIAEDVDDKTSVAEKSLLSESGLSNRDKSRGQWIWKPFSEIREECMKDLHRSGDLPSFLDSLRLDTSHSPDILSNLSAIISEEGSRMHIPVCSNEYIVSDFEGEISSIVAAALSQIIDSCHPPENLSDEGSEDSLSLCRAASEPSPLWALSKKSFKEADLIHTAPSMNFGQSRFSSFDGSNLLDSLVSYGSPHREVPLGVEKHPPKGKYSVVCFYTDEFRSLRDSCCPSELDYIASLSRCKIWDAKGGKSKSFFAKTLDDRLIIKEIKRTELESFMKFAANYFKYMKESVNAGNQTCLAKILGIYQVTVRPTKNGKETKHDLMVMENLSFGRSISCQYDLKGALHARYTDTSDGSGDVLLDQNFVIDMNNSPMYVGQKAKRLLQRAVWNDTGFLNEINVMDYSLLVGVDKQRKELVCGIIDYLRQYTWDKQLESWVKSSLKNVTPTIISPIEYKKRFKKFMDTHFMSVPDRWCSRRSTPCKLCGIDEGAAAGGDRIHSSPSLSSLVKYEDQEQNSSSHAV